VRQEAETVVLLSKRTPADDRGDGLVVRVDWAVDVAVEPTSISDDDLVIVGGLDGASQRARVVAVPPFREDFSSRVEALPVIVAFSWGLETLDRDLRKGFGSGHDEGGVDDAGEPNRCGCEGTSSE
jgi:hypothetical protein